MCVSTTKPGLAATIREPGSWTEPLPVEVREHTAQLTLQTGRAYQRRFMDGDVNVLSSSTTFEMGIDVGLLRADPDDE